MNNIHKLLALVAQYPEIKRIDFDNNEHRIFCSKVLTAAGKAAGDIMQLLANSEQKPPTALLDGETHPDNPVFCPPARKGKK